MLNMSYPIGIDMTKFETVRISSKGQLVIPKDIRAAAGIEEGDELLVAIDGEAVVVTKVESLARASRGILKGTWGRTRQQADRTLRAERESWD